ncbi:MAG: hypothetical protein ACK4GQ_05205, partial [Candidatus Hadarchaeales archaeon]
MADLLLSHGTVVTMNAKREILLDGAVVVEGNSIVAVGKTSEIKKSSRQTWKLTAGKSLFSLDL